MHNLTIGHIKKETKNCVTIGLIIPDELENIFSFKAGQYLTVEVDVAGNAHRRAYSISSAPHEGKLEFSVKQVAGGKVSTFLNNLAKIGDQLRIWPPAGRCIVEPEPESRITYYFFGAGSGITPLFSMIKSILETEPLSTVYLMYGNATPEDVIYKEELDRLVKEHEGQFALEHVFSQANGWTGRTGRIDQSATAYFINNYPKNTREERFYICGPGNMIETVEEALIEMDVYSGDIYKEYFVNDNLTVPETTSDLTGLIHAVLNGEEIRMEWDRKNSILDNLLEAGYDPPFSCQSGICTTCIAKVLEGEVTPDNQLGLTKKDIEQGYCLTCQARPVSSFISVDYDNV